MNSTDRNTLSRAAEDCLLLVHRLSERQVPPTTSGLARSLGVADSTVTAMLHRLSKLQLLNYQARKLLSLTESGKREAQRLIRRHRLIETYLWVHLGYSLSEVHDEAERLEHVVTDKFVDAVAKQLGHPSVDPHGEPIPNGHGEIVQRELRSLSELKEGETGKLALVQDTRPQTLSYLEGLGLYIGARVEVVAVPGADKVRTLRAGKREMTVSEELASHVWVEDITI